MRIMKYSIFMEAFGYTEHIRKTRSSSITKDEVINILKTNCKEFLKNPISKVYRGLGDNDSDYLLVKPSEHNRRSANTKNIYTLFIDNSYRWKGYPKRSKSIICTTNESTASDYGFHFVVVPFDGAKFGVCPSHDIWFSFSEINDMGFNSNMDTFVYDLEVSDSDYESMTSDLEKLEKEIIDKEGKVSFWTRHSKSRFASDFYNKHKENNISLYEFIDELLDPKENGFYISDYARISTHSDSEVWTDSNCLLISPRALKEILNELNNNNQKTQ